MIHIKDNIYLADKSAILSKHGRDELEKNKIKTILLCTEYIDLEVLRNKEAAEFILKNKIKLNVLFDTQKLIHETRLLMKGTEIYKSVRDDLRRDTLKRSDLLKRISDIGDERIVLICNHLNKMSPIIYLMLENYRRTGPIEYKQKLSEIYIKRIGHAESESVSEKTLNYFKTLMS